MRSRARRILERMDREALANFLRHQRLELQPAEVGLHQTQRRRTPGLRREEVAALAHVSTDFYTRLEQNRGSRPSEQTTGSLARALRLTPTEREHLFHLAGHTPPPRNYRSDQPSPGLLRVLDSIQVPAQITSDLGVTLGQNQLAQALVGDQTQYSGLRRSIIYRWFADPGDRGLHPPQDHPMHSRIFAGTLRATQGRHGEDPEADELVNALLRESPEFAEIWERHEVLSRADTIKRFVHPELGLLSLDCQMLTAESLTERLIVFTAPPGSEDGEKLALLAVIGTQRF
jgi:transcriptional regulator with XRE-family HTH domain